MDDLERQVRLEWFDMRENGDDVYALEEVFEYTPSELRDIASQIRMAVEGGIIEYKRSAAAGAFTFIDGFRYDARGFERLIARGRDLRPVVYATLIQRLIALGKIRRPKAEISDDAGDTGDRKRNKAGGAERTGGEHVSDAVSAMDIKTIVGEVNERIRSDPDLSTHQAVQNIFLQVKVYQKELSEMNKLRPNIPREKLAPFLENFRHTFDEITRKVRDSYRELVDEETKAETPQGRRPPLEAADTPQAAKIIFEQARVLASVSIAMVYAGKERYKVGAILEWAARQQAPLNASYAEEAKKYALLSPFAGGARELSKAFSAEIVRILERRASRDETS
jgi:hypothetical protein